MKTPRFLSIVKIRTNNIYMYIAAVYLIVKCIFFKIICITYWNVFSICYSSNDLPWKDFISWSLNKVQTIPLSLLLFTLNICRHVSSNNESPLYLIVGMSPL